jgi:hypothetical protein
MVITHVLEAAVRVLELAFEEGTGSVSGPVMDSA